MKIGTRLYIHLDRRYSGTVDGLCGNYDGNSRNDVDGIISGRPTSTVQEFGNNWKIEESCASINDSIFTGSPCDVSVAIVNNLLT